MTDLRGEVTCIETYPVAIGYHHGIQGDVTFRHVGIARRTAISRNSSFRGSPSEELIVRAYIRHGRQGDSSTDTCLRDRRGGACRVFACVKRDRVRTRDTAVELEVDIPIRLLDVRQGIVSNRRIGRHAETAWERIARFTDIRGISGSGNDGVAYGTYGVVRRITTPFGGVVLYFPHQQTMAGEIRIPARFLTVFQIEDLRRVFCAKQRLLLVNHPIGLTVRGKSDVLRILQDGRSNPAHEILIMRRIARRRDLAVVIRALVHQMPCTRSNAEVTVGAIFGVVVIGQA